MLGKEETLQRVRHHYQTLRHIATGHYDCAGEMICRHDAVQTPAGRAYVLWAGGRWMLYYSRQQVEGLNRRGAADLRRIANVQ